MKRYLPLLLAVLSFFSALTPTPSRADEIPENSVAKASWTTPAESGCSEKNKNRHRRRLLARRSRRRIRRRNVFSRTYRGDFARWHIKSGVHKYAPVYANQFAMFQQVAGDPAGTAQVLMTDHPKNGELSSWQWDYPVGAGEICRAVSQVLV